MAAASVLGLAGLLRAGGGLPRWHSSAFLHLLALAGLAAAAMSLLGRSRFGKALPPGVRSRAGRIHTVAAAALLLLLCVLTASAVTAEYPAAAWPRLACWACLAGWGYLMARSAGTRRRLAGWCAVLAVFGVAASVLGAVEAIAQGGDVPHHPFVNQNHLGALAAATFPLLAALFAVSHRRLERLAWIVLWVPVLGALLLSRSTAALGALIAALLTLAAGWGASWWKGRGDAVAGAMAAGVVLLALLGPIAAGRSTLAERAGMTGVARVEEPHASHGWKSSPGVHWMRLRLLFEGRPDVSVASRLRYSRATMLALKDEPVLGFGPGAVPLTFARYRLQVPGASPWGEAVGQLHSVALQRLYESGMAGLAAFAIWVLLSILGRPSADPARAWLRTGLAGGVAALAVSGAADALEPAPALIAVGFALIVLLSVRHEARARERLPRWSFAVAGAGVILVALFAAAGWLRSDLGQRREERAVLRVRNVLGGRIDAAVLEDLRAAVKLDPSLGLYAHQAAYAAEELALRSLKDGNEERAAALFEESERLHLDVVRRFADVHGFASQAGNFLIDRDRPAEAIPYLRKAVALDYYNPLGHFYLGEAFRLLGREAEAVEAHARAIRFYPRLAAAALWSAPGAQQLRRRVLERVRGLLLEESALPDPDTASGRLLRHIERLLREQAAPEESKSYPRVLSARLDAVLGTSRAWHLFGRLGFAMENLPVTVLEEQQPPQEDAWARVLEGLPVLTAAELERPRQRQAPAGLREETDAKPAGRPPRQAGMRTGNGGQSA